jgi:tRNA(Ile)-lysidine synthase
MQRPGEIKNKNKNIEYISADNLPREFEIRNWIEGDRFKPLGMKGTKKISDFLNEQKIPPSKKKSQLMLTNSGKIVWVIGLRIDDRFKVNTNTKQVYKLCLS